MDDVLLYLDKTTTVLAGVSSIFVTKTITVKLQLYETTQSYPCVHFCLSCVATGVSSEIDCQGCCN